MSDCNSKLKNENIKLSISADEVVLKEWSGNSYSDMPSLINSLKEAKQFLNDFLTGFIETKTSVNAVHNVVSDEMCEEDEKGDQDASSKPVQKLQAETQILCMKSSTDVQNNFQKTKRLKK